MPAFLESIGYDGWILPALLVLPLLGAIGIWVHGAISRPDRRAVAVAEGMPDEGTAAHVGVAPGGVVVVPEPSAAARGLAFGILLLEFVLSAGLWWSFDPSNGGWQATFDAPWIPEWGARLSMGVDGISLMMVLLTTFIMPLAVLGGWTSIRAKTHTYYALLLVLTTGMLGVFVARDLLLFYLMWEVMLVPMYFIIGVWGGERRLYAALKFFVYTMLGSLLMLVAILYLWQLGGSGTFDYDALLQVAMQRLGPTAALLCFGAFFLAFAVKVPMFPFHTWLPDAHVEAPTAGSVILAAIMLKMGTYGFLRFAVPLFPDTAMQPAVRTTILVLAVVGIVYGALVALVQPDFKKLVAYSSVSHLGFVMLGIFALTLQSVQGALMVMISHGLTTGALFLLIGMIYERRHTRDIAAYGGIARVVPLFAAMLVFATLGSIGLPSTSGFVGEFLVLVGAFRTHPWLTFFATTGVIFAAAYMLWAVQRVIFNPLDRPENATLSDLNGRELALMMPIVVAVLWLGLYPAPVLRRMEASAQRFVQTVESGAAERAARVGEASGAPRVAARRGR
jgi:NADH-quinone oxidoreductase subunit M